MTDPSTAARLAEIRQLLHRLKNGANVGYVGLLFADIPWLLDLVQQQAEALDRLEGIRSAKYLNGMCGFKGCQWLTEHYAREQAEARIAALEADREEE